MIKLFVKASAACAMACVPASSVMAQGPSQTEAAGPQMPAPVSASDQISLSQAQQIAAVQSPQLGAAKHQILAAKANLSGQRVPVNPEFYVGGLNNTVSQYNPFDLHEYAVIATVETNGAIAWRTSQAKNQLLATTADAETTRITVRQAVAQAYATLQVADAALAIEKESYDTTVRLDDLTQKQFQLGAAPETNAIRTRIAVTQEESNFLRAINAVKNARATLNVQLGRNPDVPVDVAEPLNFHRVVPEIEELKRLAIQSRPEIKSAEYNIKAQHAAAGLARSQYFPNIFVGSDFKQISQGQIDVGLQVPLFDFGSIRGAVRQANEQVRVQQAQAEQTRQQVLLDVQSGYDELMRTVRTVQAYQDGILPRSESLLHRVEEGYRLGANTILDLIDAESTYRSSRNDYASALGDYRQALAQLERAIGAPLPIAATASAETKPASGGQK